jgi:hypothetical protein
MNMLQSMLMFWLLLGQATVAGVPLPEPEWRIPDEIWVDIYFRSFDPAAEAAGLEPLRNMSLPDGRKEVRIWFSGSGPPGSFYRFEKFGSEVHGEIIFYWGTAQPHEEPGQTFHDFLLHVLSGSCDGFQQTSQKAICRAEFAEEPDWHQTYEQAVDAGLWWLPDDSALQDGTGVTFGGWSIVVELRDGWNYRVYKYSNPQLRDDWPEAVQIIKIVDVLRNVRSMQRRPDAEKHYRGIMSGQVSNAFRPCGSSEPLVLGTVLFETARFSNMPLPLPGRYGYEVEMSAIAIPEWMVVSRGWPAGQVVLQSIRLKSARPANNPFCE